VIDRSALQRLLLTGWLERRDRDALVDAHRSRDGSMPIKIASTGADGVSWEGKHRVIGGGDELPLQGTDPSGNNHCSRHPWRTAQSWNKSCLVAKGRSKPSLVLR